MGRVVPCVLPVCALSTQTYFIDGMWPLSDGTALLAFSSQANLLVYFDPATGGILRQINTYATADNARSCLTLSADESVAYALFQVVTAPPPRPPLPLSSCPRPPSAIRARA